MQEIRRTDSLDIEHYAKYLEENGLNPQKNPLQYRDKVPSKNVVGFNTEDMPIILDTNIRLSSSLPSEENKPSKFKKVEG